MLRMFGYGITAILIMASLLLARPDRSAALRVPQGTITPRAVRDGDTTGEFTLTPVPGPGLPVAPQGLTTVIVELGDVPLATVIAQAFEDGGSFAEASAAARAQRAVIRQRQAVLVDILTAPPFDARLVGTTQIVSVTIIIVVDASLIEQIRALPGVRSARPDRFGTLDAPPETSPGIRPDFGPSLDGELQ